MVQTRVFAWEIQKSHLKPLKINCCWVIAYVCLYLSVGWTSLKKVCGTIGKWKFSFSVCSTQFELSLIQKWSLVLFPLAHNETSKMSIFFKPSNRQNGDFNNHKQLIIQMIFMASCIEEIYLKVLDKQTPWTYVRPIFELFLVISWLWFALDHLRCWEDRC